ncbi:MAG: hypothetical protein R3F20_00315 [Planctomycetota bacterium]
MKMSIGGGREQAWCELFYLLEGRYLFEQELSAGGMFHFAPGESIEVVVPFPEVVRETGRFLVRLRLDPVAGDPGAPVTIDSVSLV